MKLIHFMLLILSVNCLAQKQTAGDHLLYLSTNNSKVENKIYDYMLKRCKITGEKKYLKNSNLYLIYKMTYPGAPESSFIIDTFPIADKTGMTKAQVIVFHMEYKLPKVLRSKTAQIELLKINNKWMSKTVYPQNILITPDYLYFRSCIMIPSKSTPLPTENILKILSTSALKWAKYYKMLQQNFDMPKEKIVTELTKEKKAVK